MVTVFPAGVFSGDGAGARVWGADASGAGEGLAFPEQPPKQKAAARAAITSTARVNFRLFRFQHMTILLPGTRIRAIGCSV